MACCSAGEKADVTAAKCWMEEAMARPTQRVETTMGGGEYRVALDSVVWIRIRLKIKVKIVALLCKTKQ